MTTDICKAIMILSLVAALTLLVGALIQDPKPESLEYRTTVLEAQVTILEDSIRSAIKTSEAINQYNTEALEHNLKLQKPNY